MTSGPTTILPSGLPNFAVTVPPPDLSPYIEGNTGVIGFTSLESHKAGPHVVLISLIHGNEYAGAVALAELLSTGLKPLCGKLTIGFANLAAFERFDPLNPTASRYLEEDMNRVWDDFTLFGIRHSLELDRAREIKPIIDTADILLDLHSMLWPSAPILLCGSNQHGRQLGLEIGTPDLVVADTGHISGKRLIDYERFTEKSLKNRASLILEAGLHWQPKTIQQCTKTIYALLKHTSMLDFPDQPASSRCAEVIKTITARTNRFQFIREFEGGELIAKAGTLIAYDGDEKIYTPEDNLVMIMPSLKVGHGHTAVRLAKLIFDPKKQP